MKPNNEAVEAGARALAGGNQERFYEYPNTDRERERYRQEAREVLDAALPLLHPTIPNTVEALEATHPDTVLMAWDVADPALSYVVVRTASNDYQWAEVGVRRPGTHGELAVIAADRGITEWTVLWPIGGAA